MSVSFPTPTANALSIIFPYRTDTVQVTEAHVPGRPPLPCPLLLPSPGQLLGLQPFSEAVTRVSEGCGEARRLGAIPSMRSLPWGFSDLGSVLSDPVTPAVFLPSASPGMHTVGMHRVAWIWRATGRRGAPRGVRASLGAAAGRGRGLGGASGRPRAARKEREEEPPE